MRTIVSYPENRFVEQYHARNYCQFAGGYDDRDGLQPATPKHRRCVAPIEQFETARLYVDDRSTDRRLVKDTRI